jgi:hypothetical protein
LLRPSGICCAQSPCAASADKAHNPPCAALRVWDFVGNDFLERRLLEPWAHRPHLNGYWLVVEVPGEGLTLRLSHDPHGQHLFPTPAEAEARRADAEAQRADLAEIELRELKALLRRDR